MSKLPLPGPLSLLRRVDGTLGTWQAAAPDLWGSGVKIPNELSVSLHTLQNWCDLRTIVLFGGLFWDAKTRMRMNFMESTHISATFSQTFQPTGRRDGLQPRRDGLQPIEAMASNLRNSNGLQPNGNGLLGMMRAFRVFRLFKRVKSLHAIIVSLGRSAPGVANAFVVLLLVMAIYSILGQELLGG